MKKLIVLIIALAVKFSLASAAEFPNLRNENSYTSALAKGSDDDVKNRIKELKKRKKVLKEEEKILDQRLKLKKLEKQTKAQERRNGHKQVKLNH
jgi:hypothetical protein